MWVRGLSEGQVERSCTDFTEKGGGVDDDDKDNDGFKEL